MHFFLLESWWIFQDFLTVLLEGRISTLDASFQKIRGEQYPKGCILGKLSDKHELFRAFWGKKFTTTILG